MIATTTPKQSASLDNLTDLRVRADFNAREIAEACFTDDAKTQRFELKAFARDLLPGDHRTQFCMRHRIDKNAPLSVNVNPGLDGASSYANVMTCGNVWTCPVCAAKVTEKRRLELAEAVETHLAKGGGVMLLTFTAQHFKHEKTELVLSDMLDSHRKFWGNKFGRGLKNAWGVIDGDGNKKLFTIRGLEATFTDNGPHVHFHTLVFINRPMVQSEGDRLQDKAAQEWQKILDRVGRYSDLNNGINVRVGDANIGDYVAKYGVEKADWTISHEVAKSHVKTAHKGGRTPNKLLYDYGRGDKEAGKIWQEYVTAFKGKSQLKWSRGLRDYLGLGAEADDEQLAADNEAETPSYEIVQLPPDAWRIIIKQALEAELLNEARDCIKEGGGQARLKGWLEKNRVYGAIYPKNEYFEGIIEGTGPPLDKDED